METINYIIYPGLFILTFILRTILFNFISNWINKKYPGLKKKYKK